MTKEFARPIIAQLRGYLWHTTSVDGFRGIVSEKSIRVNRGDLPNAWDQSSCSNCFEENAVSLFDFVTHRDEDLVGEDLLLLQKWPGVMFRHRPTVFLGMAIESLASNLLFYSELKRRRGFGGVIPRIEVCHVGDIPWSTVKMVGISQGLSSPRIDFYSSVQAARDSLICDQNTNQ